MLRQLEAVGIFENGELAYDRRRRSPTPPPANEGEEVWGDRLPVLLMIILSGLIIRMHSDGRVVV